MTAPDDPHVPLSRETTIRRTAEGRWFHDGEPVENQPLARAFDRWVCRADDGRYCLKNSINWAYITLEGAPYFVRAVHIDKGHAKLTLSNDDTVPLDPHSLREDEKGQLYCTAYHNMPARFDSHAAVQLSPLLDEDDKGAYFQHEDQVIYLPRVEDPLGFQKP